jgi:UDP-N-acetylglucosamine acyltransferase
MPEIHPTAIVDRNAQIDDDVRIGPCTVIGPRVRIGRGTSVGSHCIIERRTVIGRYNRICHHVLLGGEPQDLKFRGEDTALIIGDHNEIRENVTVHVGTANGGGKTTVGSHNLLMVGAHIAHDCHVGDHCVLSNNIMFAGHISVQDYAVLAGGAAVTHYATIGRYAFIGGLAGVVHDCPPYMMSDGHPARVRSVNTVGLARHGFDPEVVEKLKKAYMLLWGQKARRANRIGAALEEAEATLGDDPHVMELVNFTRRMVAATHGRHAESFRPDDKRATPTR